MSIVKNTETHLAERSEAAEQDQTAASTAPSYFSSSAAGNPYRPYQWYLDGYLTPDSNVNGANVDKISTEYSGHGVKIGLIDSGFDISNADLAGQFDLSLSYDPHDAGAANIMPDSSADVHGTWVAGVVGANGDNGLGTVGVAPGATLVGYYARFGMGGSSRAEMSDLLARQVNVDISNNSWGYSTEFADNFLDPAWAGMKDAIVSGVNQGREGLGTIYVFGAGNDRQYVANSTIDGDNTNYHSLTNNRFTITAAASTQDGHITSFSTPGASILVTAPGEWIATTTVEDGDGNPANDHGFVSGTSFSAPIVSGVVAMMLEANRNLGYRDVQEILALSSHKIDPTSSSWATNGATNWNGGGNLVSHDFGFGLVDAHAAVRLAETWTTAHTAANEAAMSVTGDVGGNTTLIDFLPNVYTTTVSSAYQDFSIDWVEVDVSLLHTHVGDLKIELISPTGTHSVLMDRPAAGNNARDNLTFTFSTTHDWGESLVGNWTLVVTDEGNGGTGSMVSFALHFYGDYEGSNDTYYYTDDFATLSGDRTTLTDTDGTDTINAAAVTTNLLLDLMPGSTLTIAGRQVVSTSDTVIENAFGGDGNDVIVGNAAGNYLSGGAGDDLLGGKAGNDTLAGGAGADLFIYIVGDGADTIIDFSAVNGDKIDLTGEYIATLTALLVCAMQVGADTVIDFGNGDTLTLQGVDFGQLDAGWFMLATSHAPTDIALSNDCVVSNSPIGTVIGSLSAMDADLGETFTYALLDDYGGLFAIDGRNLVLRGVLDGTLSFDLTIRVTDGENHTFEKSFSIAAMDEGEFVTTGGEGGGRTYFGGTGDDTYYVTSAGDLILESANAGLDTVHTLVTYTLPANVESLVLIEGAGAIGGTGNGLDNTIFGNSSSNVIDGGTGADRMSGGAGDDTFFVDDVGDVVTENANEGADTVKASITYVLAANVENMILMAAAGAINGTGNSLDNTITGNSSDNVIDGGAGADSMIGGVGNDTYVVDNAADVVTENANEGTDTVNASISCTLGENLENLILMAGAGAINGTGNGRDNTITGNSSNNVIDGAVGADTMVGGAGNDTYFIDIAGDVVAENANEGSDLVNASISYTLGANVENLILLAGAINGTGNSLDNTLTGNSGNNILDGGTGIDTVDYSSTAQGVVVNLSVAQNQAVGSEIGTDQLVNIENIVGGSGNDTITGDATANVLAGGAGADTLIGKAGNDTYYVDNPGDVVIENAGEGYDLIKAWFNYFLSANVEALVLAEGAGSINGVGNSADNTIVGNSDSNTLDGRAGNDVMIGSGGSDIYFVDSIGDAVVENPNEGNDIVYAWVDYTLPANVEAVVLIGASGANNLAGNDADNALIGNSRNNALDGKGGDDYLVGGTGNDIYVVDSSGDEVVENADEGSDIVYASIDYTIGANVESLVLVESAGAVNGAGNSTDNALIGNSSSNVLDGRGGHDYMVGGAGDDIYVVDSVGDMVVENPNEGGDIVYASIDCTIGPSVESLVLVEGAGAINGAGNSTDNALVGNSSNNVLDGRGGHDYMVGGAGDDIYVVDTAGDAVVENLGEGADIVYASKDYTIGANVESLVLVEGAGAINGSGNSVDNAVIGNSSNNVIDGKSGHDFLRGNGGDDTFVFARGEANGDMVFDFSGNGAAAGDSFRFVGYGTIEEGATFTQIDGIHWSVNSADGLTHDIITLQNSASVHASDYVFV